MKKKIWTVVGCFAMVLVVAATSVGITLAALQGQVSSTFNISYTAKNVKAAIVGWVEIYMEFEYEDYDIYDRPLRYIRPLTVDEKDYVEFMGNESGTLSKQFDPIKLDFQIDSKVVNDIKEILFRNDLVPEDELDMSALSIYDWLDFNICMCVINLEQNELPVQYNLQNYKTTGDASTILYRNYRSYWQDFQDISSKIPFNDTLSAADKTMTFSQYAAELKQKMGDEWEGEFPDYRYGTFMDASVSDEFLAAFQAEYYSPSREFDGTNVEFYKLELEVNNHINAATFSGNINLTLGTF